MKIENLRQWTNERMNISISWAPYRAIKPLIMVQFQLSYLANVELSSLLWWGKNFNLDKASPYYFNSSYFFITFLPGNKNILTFTSRLGNKINLSLDTFIVLLHKKEHKKTISKSRLKMIRIWMEPNILGRGFRTWACQFLPF